MSLLKKIRSIINIQTGAIILVICMFTVVFVVTQNDVKESELVIKNESNYSSISEDGRKIDLELNCYSGSKVLYTDLFEIQNNGEAEKLVRFELDEVKADNFTGVVKLIQERQENNPIDSYIVKGEVIEDDGVKMYIGGNESRSLDISLECDNQIQSGELYQFSIKVFNN